MRILQHYGALQASSDNFLLTSKESVNYSTEPELKPAGFRLYQNFPQTFYRVTRIGFDIPEATNVKIGIYDTFGREICVLVDEVLDSGNYEVVFDASSFKLDPGMLMYKIKTGEFADTKKMFLLKENNILS